MFFVFVGFVVFANAAHFDWDGVKVVVDGRFSSEISCGKTSLKFEFAGTKIITAVTNATAIGFSVRRFSFFLKCLL